MEQRFKEQLSEAGVNLKQTLERFMGNEALYEKFLSKYTQDPNMGALEGAVQDADYRAVEMYAHTLKGVSANLGIDLLVPPLSEMVQIVRSNEGFEKLEGLLSDVREKYTRICSLINAR